MSTALESYEKLNYAVRPSKQVERKLMIEALHFLGHNAGYRVSSYTYLGFGSIYYVDFVLFHKYLYIDRMICVECSDIPKRMRFNKPYRFIKLHMGTLSSIIPMLRFNKRYIVWLDYDYGLDYGVESAESSIVEDVSAFASKLSPGSILLVTAEAEPRLSNRRLNAQLTQEQRDQYLYQAFTDNYGILLGEVSKGDLTRKGLPKLVASVLGEQMRRSMLTNRHDVDFHQLFNFVYSDGAQMVTVGGIIDVPESDRKLEECGVYDLPFIERGASPMLISVPQLTLREKEAIDAKIMGRRGRGSVKVRFELRQEFLDNYQKYYKHYPTYYEALL